MKTITLSLIFTLLTSACISKAQSSVPDAKPQFVIKAGDVDAAPVLMPADSTEGIVDVHFTGQARTEFIKFSLAHRDQQVQLFFDKQVVGKPVIDGRYTPGAILVHYPTVEEAKKVAALLTKK